jgi:hypothetical protein
MITGGVIFLVAYALGGAQVLLIQRLNRKY